MEKEVNLKSKTLYKLTIYLLKIIPMVLAFICILNTVLSVFYIDLPILSFIGGTSILTLLFLYIASYAFRFCNYHRMFLHYILVYNTIVAYDYYYGIDISDNLNTCMHAIIAGVFLFIILYMYVKKSNNKTA